MPDFHQLQDVLTLPANKYGPRLKPIVGLIDSVHSIRTTFQIPVRITKNRQNQGEYHYRRGSFEPDYIEISRINDSMEATLLHEVGHFLEQAILPGCQFGQPQWSGAGLTAGWLESVESTAGFRALRAIHERDGPRSPGAVDEFEMERILRRRWVEYLMTPRELWARSYAQWVADRGNHVDLM